MNPYNITPYIRYSVYRKCPPSGWKIDTRTIPDQELVLITGGEGCITVEDKVYTARQGLLFYFCPNIRHSLKSMSDNPMTFYGLHFSFAHVNYSNSIWSIDGGADLLPLKPVTEIGAHMKLELILKELNSYWNSKAPGYELICNGLFMQFLYAVLQDIKACNVNYSSGQKVREVMEHIGGNLDRKLTINQLALLVNLSPDYLSAIFKEFTGYPIIKYINKCRVDAAKSLLDGGGRKVKDVALLLGFRDEFYFSKVFKRYEGMSPQEFYKNRC